MKDKIKEILDYLKNNTFIPDETKRKYKILHRDEVYKLLDYITNLQEENERLKELYRRTCNHLFNIGNDELARYFQAQINECNTFTVQGVGKNE